MPLCFCVSVTERDILVHYASLCHEWTSLPFTDNGWLTWCIHTHIAWDLHKYTFVHFCVSVYACMCVCVGGVWVSVCVFAFVCVFVSVNCKLRSHGLKICSHLWEMYSRLCEPIRAKTYEFCLLGLGLEEFVTGPQKTELEMRCKK